MKRIRNEKDGIEEVHVLKDHGPKDLVHSRILIPLLLKKLKMYEETLKLFTSESIQACNCKTCDVLYFKTYTASGGTRHVISNYNEILRIDDHRKGFLCPKCNKWYCKAHLPDTFPCEACINKDSKRNV